MTQPTHCTCCAVLSKPEGTPENIAVTLRRGPAVVPPGYWLNTATSQLVKCPNNVAGAGYYRSGWVSYKLAQDTDGTRACTRCGSSIKSEPRDQDERDDLPADDGSDSFYGLVAATAQSCYIEAGWGISFDPANMTQFRAIAPCPANTYGESALRQQPCRPTSAEHHLNCWAACRDRTADSPVHCHSLFCQPADGGSEGGA